MKLPEVLQQVIAVCRALPAAMEDALHRAAGRAVGRDARQLLLQFGLEGKQHERQVLSVQALTGCDALHAAEAVGLASAAGRDPEELVRVLTAEQADPVEVAQGWMAGAIWRERYAGQPSAVLTWHTTPDGEAPDAPPVDLTDCVESIEPHRE